MNPKIIHCTNLHLRYRPEPNRILELWTFVFALWKNSKSYPRQYYILVSLLSQKELKSVGGGGSDYLGFLDYEKLLSGGDQEGFLPYSDERDG